MEESKPSGKRRGRRWPIVVGVIAAVVVAAGAGFWVWHEQPSFCNAVCHDPMDVYVEATITTKRCWRAPTSEPTLPVWSATRRSCPIRSPKGCRGCAAISPLTTQGIDYPLA